jgi:hypothetical protein
MLDGGVIDNVRQGGVGKGGNQEEEGGVVGWNSPEAGFPRIGGTSSMESHDDGCIPRRDARKNFLESESAKEGQF